MVARVCLFCFVSLPYRLVIPPRNRVVFILLEHITMSTGVGVSVVLPLPCGTGFDAFERALVCGCARAAGLYSSYYLAYLSATCKPGVRSRPTQHGIPRATVLTQSFNRWGAEVVGISKSPWARSFKQS